MIGATLTTRLAQDGITKSTVTTFALAFLVYNLKFLWAWVVDGVRLPLLGRLGQRVSWLIFAGLLVMAAVANLAFQDPSANIYQTAIAAILVGVAGATFDIVIDAYRIELLEPRQLGVGSGMSQYGWRIGSVAAGALALVLAARVGWEMAYLACAAFALPAMLTGLIVGEPKRHKEPTARKGMARGGRRHLGPFAEFFKRRGALLVLLFILLHKIGDTLGQLVLRLLLDDMGYTNDEIAIWDVGVGFWAYLIGIFVGGVLYAKIGMKRSVLISLILMGVSNATFAFLAMAGHTNIGLGGVHRVREFRQRHRRRRRRRLLLGALQSAVHRLSICADLGGGERRRARADRHDGGRDRRGGRLCQFLLADDGRRAARDHPVLADDALRPGR